MWGYWSLHSGKWRTTSLPCPMQSLCPSIRTTISRDNLHSHFYDHFPICLLSSSIKLLVSKYYSVNILLPETAQESLLHKLDTQSFLRGTVRVVLFFLVLSIQSALVFTVIHAVENTCIFNCLVSAAGTKIKWYRMSWAATLLFALDFKCLNSYGLPHLYWDIFPSGFANPRNKIGDVQAWALGKLVKW